jgi:uncharacterized protein
MSDSKQPNKVGVRLHTTIDGIAHTSRNETNDYQAHVLETCGEYDGHWNADMMKDMQKTHQHFDLSSYYVQMSDGIELAVDVYLPIKSSRSVSRRQGQGQGSGTHHVMFDETQCETDMPMALELVPAMLHMTRYFRNWRFGSCATPCSVMCCCCCCGVLSKDTLKMSDCIPSSSGNDPSHWNMRSVRFASEFLSRGIAWVSVDCRGTGASQGTRPHDLTARERLDFKELAEWICAQPWSNQAIGSTGISYDGMTGMCLASHGLPQVRAIAPLFSPLDLYTEIAYPGGVRCVGFTKEYSKFTYELERNAPQNTNMPGIVKWIVKCLMNGVRPVSTADEAALQHAVEQHADNWNIIDMQRQLCNRDDKMPGTGAVMSDMSVDALSSQIVNAPTHILAIAGWFDSGTALGASRLFLTKLKQYTTVCEEAGTGTAPSGDVLPPRLILGPWNHGARNHCIPDADNSEPEYPLFSALVRHFEPLLKADAKNPCTLADCEFQDGQLVTYFTMNGGGWQSCASWPPRHTAKVFHFDAANNALQLANTAEEQLLLLPLHEMIKCDIARGDAVEMKFKSVTHGVPCDDDDDDDSGKIANTRYLVDHTASSGEFSRWNLVKHMFKSPITYPDRAEADTKLACFDSAPLTHDMQVTGAPYVQLFMSIDSTDSAVFAYLEAVLPNGQVHYVTEAQLRLAHRAFDLDHVNEFEDLTPFRPYESKTQRAIKAYQPLHALLTFHPCSYLFTQGSRIRVSIAGADAFNFDPAPDADPVKYFRIYADAPTGLLSQLVLPQCDL